MNKPTKLTNITQTLTTFAKTIFTEPARIGSLFAIGFITTSLIAVAVGNLTTWTAGQTLTAKNLNDNFESLRSAVDSIPNWTKGTTSGSAFYTAGNVGIGTSTTTAGTLTVRGSGTASGVNLQTQNSAGTALVTVLDSGNVGIGTTAPASALEVSGTVQLRGVSTGTGLVVNSSGNVGIGTSSPSYALDVMGPGTVAARINATTSNQASPEAFVVMSGNSNITGFQIAHWDSASAGTAWLSFPNTDHVAHTSDIQLSTRGFFPGVTIKNSNRVGIGTASPAQTLSVNGNAGNTTGVWVTNSDFRLKKNIETLSPYLDRLTSLRPVTFEWKDPAKLNATEGKHIGFIAQEMEKVFPNWVDTDKTGYKWLNMEGMNAAFVKALQELVERGKAREKEFNQKLSKLEEENAELKATVAKFDSDRVSDKQRISNLEAKLEKMMVAMERQSVGIYAKK